MKVSAWQRGFTLLEVMVVVVILGILAALVVPKIISRPDDARVIAAKQDIASLMQALKLYRLDNQRYPVTEQGLQALVAPPTTAPLAPNWKAGGYVERLPRDPWGNPYQYLNPGIHGEIDVFSFGADGAPGGEGNDAGQTGATQKGEKLKEEMDEILDEIDSVLEENAEEFVKSYVQKGGE